MISFSERLSHEVQSANSRLCVGLDVDASRIHGDVSPSLQRLEGYTHKVIDATLDVAVAYKLNFAFFERYGAAGWRWLEQAVKYLDGRRIIIADGKRGDIANSAQHYAAAMFDHLGCDAVTVTPYMGRDALQPFTDRPEKGVFVVCLTSNDGAADLQLMKVNGKPIYETVIEMVESLNRSRNCGLVVGATRGGELEKVRKAAGEMPLLIPGVGAQGGDLEASVTIGNRGGVGLINVSRSILYAGDQSEGAIRKAAEGFHTRINAALTN